MITFCLMLFLQQDPLKDGDAVTPVQKWFAESRVKKDDALRIRDEAAWKELWDRHKETKGVKPPAVDFTKHMVVVFPRPMAFGCIPPELVSLDVRETKEALRVIAEIRPGRCDNDMHGHPMMMGKAALIVVVPRDKKRVDLVEKPKAGEPKVVMTLDALKE